MTLDPAPAWLPGGQAQTVWPALFSRSHDTAEPIVYRRERHTTPDADFVDIDWLDAPAGQGAGLLVLFHGLEGSSRSHYALAFADWARRHGWRFAVPHFRGCSGELNLAPRAYHSGDYAEIGWMLDRIRASQGGGVGPVVAVGVSLGGNALLRWAQESGAQAERVVQAVASVCSPIDLAAAGHAIGRGLNRHLYTPMFLRTMKPKALAKLAQHPASSTPTGCARRVTSTNSTTSSPPRCTATATPRTTGAALPPSRIWPRSAFPRWSSMRATIPSCLPTACRVPMRLAAMSPCGNPTTGAMSGLRPGPRLGMCVACRGP